MNNIQQISAEHRFGSSSSSYVELQSFYSKSLSSQKAFMQPQLLEMLEGEETKCWNLGSGNLSVIMSSMDLTVKSDLVDYAPLDCSTPSCSQTLTTNSLEFPSFRPLKDADLPDEKFQSRDTLQSLVQSCCCGNQGQEKSIQSPGDNIQECKHHQQNKLIISERPRNLSDYSLVSFEKNIGVSRVV